MVKRSYLHVIGIPEWWETKNKTEVIFEAVMS